MSEATVAITGGSDPLSDACAARSNMSSVPGSVAPPAVDGGRIVAAKSVTSNQVPLLIGMESSSFSPVMMQLKSTLVAVQSIHSQVNDILRKGVMEDLFPGDTLSALSMCIRCVRAYFDDAFTSGTRDARRAYQHTLACFYLAARITFNIETLLLPLGQIASPTKASVKIQGDIKSLCSRWEKHNKEVMEDQHSHWNLGAAEKPSLHIDADKPRSSTPVRKKRRTDEEIKLTTTGTASGTPVADNSNDDSISIKVAPSVKDQMVVMAYNHFRFQNKVANEESPSVTLHGVSLEIAAALPSGLTSAADVATYLQAEDPNRKLPWLILSEEQIDAIVDGSSASIWSKTTANKFLAHIGKKTSKNYPDIRKRLKEYFRAYWH